MGTICQNRIPKSCPVLDNKAMNKKPLGSHDYASTGQVVIVKWKDNQVVSIDSTAHGVAPLSSTSRYSREERKCIQVPSPRVFLEYNKAMGGTDPMDGNVAKYRIAIQGKKWWWPIFTWLIDVSINNAWILLMKNCTNDISQLDFKRQIVQTYLISHSSLPKGGGRPATSKSGGRVLKSIRYDRLDHYIKPVP